MHCYCYSSGLIVIHQPHAGSSITTDSKLPPENELPSQNNEGLVAGVTVSLILLISGAATVTLFVLYQRKTSEGIRINLCDYYNHQHLLNHCALFNYIILCR